MVKCERFAAVTLSGCTERLLLLLLLLLELRLPLPPHRLNTADSPPFVIQQLECAQVALLPRVQWGFGASLETREKRKTLKTQDPVPYIPAKSASWCTPKPKH
ncbi:hypothetical protein PHYPO_G00065350 [Pangasianodon hypophthalmus]|uniref:Secreted protein n=1 Tax=Pangasianodon hypophthalmus TaxID=310915 RepID=A0A5N5M2F9_PANHP|nr:hypothetical protein PHYPO_G00065350 [Pangasianodon hypophthalmus]